VTESTEAGDDLEVKFSNPVLKSFVYDGKDVFRLLNLDCLMLLHCGHLGQLLLSSKKWIFWIRPAKALRATFHHQHCLQDLGLIGKDSQQAQRNPH
jgi:hypothetical protein